MFSLLADIVVATHLIWIGFLIFGALIGRKIRPVMWLHLGSLVFSVVLQINYWICPLTHLEVWLRGKSGGAYSGPFIQRYVERLVYLNVSRTAVFVGTVVVIAGTLLLYRRRLRRC
ncbi:MAG: DUF2784 domain-containing protein [Calditrichota bacterium]